MYPSFFALFISLPPEHILPLTCHVDPYTAMDSLDEHSLRPYDQHIRPSSFIPNQKGPTKAVDSKMFYSYVPNAIKTRKRTSSTQLQRLETVFVGDKKPSAITRKELAQELEMSPREVQVRSVPLLALI